MPSVNIQNLIKEYNALRLNEPDVDERQKNQQTKIHKIKQK